VQNWQRSIQDWVQSPSRQRLRCGAALMAVGGFACGGASVAEPADAGHGADGYQVEEVAVGLDHAWGMAFVPDTAWLLVTERPGRLSLIDRNTGERRVLDGVPEVHAQRQGGLFDVALHPEYPAQPWVYLTYAVSDDGRTSTTRLARAVLDFDAGRLEQLSVLHDAQPRVNSDGHFGSRLAFDAESRVYFSVGDRNSKAFGPEHDAQNFGNDLGAILRLTDDGGVPADNPFVDRPDASPVVYSYGHRNPQGLAFHPLTGELWSHEHGERNGDEINVIVAGGNYGWPVASYGVSYLTGRAFAVTPPENPDTVNPVFHWAPDHPEGFPPSGLAIYVGDAFPDWEGHLLMGNLRHRYLGRFTVDGHRVQPAGRLLDGRGWRIRDVAVAPDTGYIYVLVDAAAAPLLRLTPLP
jgi:aldose sugar dehydrogenase